MPGSTRTKTRIPQDDRDAHRRLATLLGSALGATRVLMLLGDAAGALDIAAAHLPDGEDAPALQRAIAPWLDEAAAERRARLRHGPAGAARGEQRSCIVAPLVDGRDVLGHLYVDVDGASGRFGRRELDLARAFAGEAALARSHRLAQEQHAAELAVIDGIQQGVAGSMHFQEVVEVVGETLRTVLGYDDLGIHWHDPQTDVDHALYVIEQGVRLALAPKTRSGPTGWWRG